MNVILTLIRDTKIMWPTEYYELLARMLALRTARRFWCCFSSLSSLLLSSPFRSHSNALQGGSECLMRLRQKTCSRHPAWDRQKTQVCISVGICGEKLIYQAGRGVGLYNLYMSVRKWLLEKEVFGATQEFRVQFRMTRMCKAGFFILLNRWSN